MTPLQRHKQNNCPLKIISANVGRRAQWYKLALNKTSLASADIVIIQDPYIYSNHARSIPKRHPSFEIFSPIDNWTSSRPRVMSYVQKNACLCSDKGYTAFSSNILLRIVWSSGKSLSIVNIYKAPPGPTSNSVLDSLYSLTLSFEGNLLISGDSNLHHTRWQPSWTCSHSPAAENFTEWADKNSLYLLSPTHMAMHDRAIVLNLLLGSSPLVQTTKCTLNPHLDTTSDHAIILTLVDWDDYTELLCRLTLDMLDKELFLCLLSINIDELSPILPTYTRETLERCAIELIEAICKT